MDVRFGQWRKLSAEELMLLNWRSIQLVLEKTLESPLDCKEIQLVHSKGDQPWVFFGRNDAKTENSSTLATTSCEKLTHWKRPWCWEGLGAGGEGDDRGWGGWMTTEDEMVGWHHWLDGREFEWTLGVGDGQGGLACCNSWGRKESDTTEWLNWSEWLYITTLFIHYIIVQLSLAGISKRR